MTEIEDDEEYWDMSKQTGLLFDVKDASISASSLLQSVQESRRENKRSEPSFATPSFFSDADLSSGVKPLETLVSKRSLTAILGEEKRKKEAASTQKDAEGHWDVPTPTRTIRAITLAKPFSLHYYRSLELKSLLLDEAVKSKNGDAILCVVLFLKKTLNNKLFSRLIQFQPSAVPSYINYLTTRLEARTVVELHLTLGQIRDAAVKDFQFSIQPHQDAKKRVQKLRNLLMDHFSTPDAEDKALVENFFKFAEWQEKNLDASSTVAVAISQLLKNHWTDGRGQPLSPYTLSALLNVSDRMLDWKAMTARAAAEDWAAISELLLTKGWLGTKKLKTVITPQKIVMELHKLRAPEPILNDFFSLIDSAEERLELATKLTWHRAVIDTLVGMKDKQGVVQYQAALNPQSNDYLHAETALRMNIKWKN